MLKQIILWVGTVVVFLGIAQAQTEQAAYQIAKPLIAEKNQKLVLSLYGKGTPQGIKTWYYNFFDPGLPTKARVVVIENGKVERFYPMEKDQGYALEKTFDPTLNKISVEKVLEEAKNYAQKNQITYDAVNLLLRRSSPGEAPQWRIELLLSGQSRGFIFLDATEGKFTRYEAPIKPKKKGFFQEVEETFLGIGGELEEFFTGERTVDQK